ncbi:tetratricopeptide repeat protein [Streptomyces uncialis]|uniref:tetratricopeptide repeat protein n=1 Tax=Streptomyces uncialis TaxID=1048205 RepID=UPI0033FF889B
MTDANAPAMDLGALRAAIAENDGRPEGPARNARAEALVVAAERLGVPLAVIEALGHQLQVYCYSSEKDKMFVPFARLLRMWDEGPQDFDEYETHSLHWAFKWMSAGMLDQPHIPLASIEKWLAEMEHRYRVAGFSERAVRSSEHSVALHIGDLERAERAHRAWRAADRDRMSDCHACELHDQAWFEAHQRHDEQALELWRPVLEGEYTCAHEPHASLASSLLPLVRVGRLDEARAHHLRGLRLVREMESMRGAYAQHVEFCALTGNEARALELLADRPAYFTDDGQPRSRMNYLAVTVLLTERLIGLGLGEQAVPGPAGRSWTARELAVHARGEAVAIGARFDERNGSGHVGAELRARMAQRPLVARLPLGVRAPRLPRVPVRQAVRPPADGPAGGGLDALLAEARRLTEARHPGAGAAWTAALGAADAAGVPLTVRDRAEIADHEAMAGADAALFERAAGLYEEAGDPDEAVEARARGAYVRAMRDGGTWAGALSALTEPTGRAVARYEESGEGARHAASMLLYQARVLMLALYEAPAEQPERTESVEPTEGVVPGAVVPEGGDGTGSEVSRTAEAAVLRLLALTEGHPDDPRLLSRRAAAHAMLAELAAFGGDTEGSVAGFTRAWQGYVAAGTPWFAAEPASRLATLARHLEDLDTATRAARAALEHGGAFLSPSHHAQLHSQLADSLARQGEVVEASAHALEAAHWADEADEGPVMGAWARHQLGGLLVQRERYAEAAEVLEAALPDLAQESHGDGTLVQTRWWLGDCLRELGDHRGAAEQWLVAADLARAWPEQRDHAMLAHMAAESLGHAGLPAEADQAYERAGELWRELGNPYGFVRSLRARAWLMVEQDAGHLAEAGATEARELMEAAVLECVAALSAADRSTAARGDEGDEGAGVGARERLVSELAQTRRQFAELLLRGHDGGAEQDPAVRTVFEEALGHMELAADAYTSLGPAARDGAMSATVAAGWLLGRLGRRAEAEGRARAVLASSEGSSDDGAGGRAAAAVAAEELLAHLAQGAGRP